MTEDSRSGITPETAVEKILSGAELTEREVRVLLATAPREALYEAAHRVTEAFKAKSFDFCSIMNARSGKCSEDCKWCAQSARWRTCCDEWGLRTAEECVAAAKEAAANGAVRFGLVTSGRALSEREVEVIAEAVGRIAKETDLCPCASLGLLSETALVRLKEAGLRRFHCNLETAPSRFPSLCSTHTVEEKRRTLLAARRVGLQICCGGILGMGESQEELVEFAFALKEIAPDSIPVNFLHPIPGTPLGDSPLPTEEQILTGVAVLRLVNPRTALRFAGGRRDMSDTTAARAVYVGISAGIAGPLLTTPGAVFADDRQLALDAGYGFGPCGRG